MKNYDTFIMGHISIDENIYQMCEIINDYSVEVRYPGDFVEPEKHEVAEAIDITEKVLDYLKRKLG